MQKSFRPQSTLLCAAILAGAIPGSAGAISDEEFLPAAVIDDRVQGQITAHGIRYDRDSDVITHPHLPFGTPVQITNLEIQPERSVIATVIDRPYPIFHSIGLSAAVAGKLGIPPLTEVEVSITTKIDKSLVQNAPKPGPTIPVSYRPPSALEPEGTSQAISPSVSAFRLQFGSFANPENAHILQRTLNGLSIPAAVSAAPDGKHYRVLSQSTYASFAQAQLVAAMMVQRGLIQEAIAVR